MSSSHSMKKLLEGLTLSNLPTIDSPYVLEIDSDSSVFDAVHLLLEHNFCSAPVAKHECATTVPCSERYCGILAPHDIMKCFLKCFKESDLAIVEEDSENEDLSPVKYMNELDRLKDYKVRDIIGQCPFEYMYNTTPIYDCMRIMSKSSSYRICVIDKQDPTKLVNFITKKKLETILYEYIISVSSFSTLTIQDLGLNRKQNLISLNEYQTMMQAIKVLVDTGYSGLPILNSVGHIVGRLCVTDVYYMFTLPSLSSILRSSIKRYLDIADIDIGCKNAANASICHDSDTVQMIVNAFLKDSWNRIFLVDKEQSPLCCITLYDLLRQLL